MRGRRFRTQADIDRYIQQGYGQGMGIDYKPWLRVQDVPSRGRSRKIQGFKIDRIYHLLSDLEYAYFLALEFSEGVTDIREQFPLLPVSDAQSIAQSLGIRYPLYAGTQLPFVLSTDFLVTFRDQNGGTRVAARTIKYASDFDSGPRLQRMLEKFEIERHFWAERDVDWAIVTDKILPPALIHNLQWVRAGIQNDPALTATPLLANFLDALQSVEVDGRTLAGTIRRAGDLMRIPYRDALQVFKHLVWHKYIRLDLRTTPLKLTDMAPELTILPMRSPAESLQAA